MTKRQPEKPRNPASAPYENVAVLIPCHDEAATIAGVVEAFATALPGATIYVYDNNSSDDTAIRAREAGATVRHEPRRGKGRVVKRMLGDIDADRYVLVDGDATYDAPSAVTMLKLLEEQGLDLVNGNRAAASGTAFPPNHRLGNRAFSSLVAWLFGRRIDDVLSGYKVMSRRFVRSFPISSNGFEIETELAVHALSLDVPMAEVETPYRARPAGSDSKLHAVSDGLRILRMILRLFKEERPLAFFGLLAALLALLSIGLAMPLVVVYLQTGLVPRVPTAVLCTGIMLTALLALTCGVILESVKRGQREIKRLLYLQVERSR